MLPSAPTGPCISNRDAANAFAAAQPNKPNHLAAKRVLRVSASTESRTGIFKDVRFYTILNFGHFWAPLFSRCFYPIMNFGHFWAPPFFKMSVFYPRPKFWSILGRSPLLQLSEALFWPKRKPKILNFCPTRNFGHFWAALSKMSCRLRRHTVFIVSCVFRNKQQRKTLADKQYSLCFLVKTSPAEGQRRFHKKHGLCPFRCLGGLGFRCVQVFRCSGFRWSMCLGFRWSMCLGFRWSMCLGFRWSMCLGFRCLGV